MVLIEVNILLFLKYGERMNDYAKLGFYENDNLITTFNYHLRDIEII